MIIQIINLKIVIRNYLAAYGVWNFVLSQIEKQRHRKNEICYILSTVTTVQCPVQYAILEKWLTYFNKHNIYKTKNCLSAASEMPSTSSYSEINN
jgi:hypothetical protein